VRGVAAWLRIEERPPHPTFSQCSKVDLSPRAGRGKIESHSRDAMRARGMPYNAPNNSAEHHRVTPEPAVGPVFGSIMLCEYLPGFHGACHRAGHFGPDPLVQPGLQQKIKRKQNAARRMSSDGPRHTGAARALTRRARLMAFHRGTCGREPTPPLSSRTRFLGRGCRRALPAVPYPSPATKSQTGHHAGRAFSR
jgi:hypothetical protein